MNLVQQLRAWIKNGDLSPDGLVARAADEITRLQNELHKQGMRYERMLKELANSKEENE
ncbi:hypothetical protein [Petrachloros mirabilis]